MTAEKGNDRWKDIQKLQNPEYNQDNIYLKNILQNFVLKSDDKIDRMRQAKLKEINNSQSDVEAFGTMMDSFYEGAVSITQKEITLINEASFPEDIRAEIINVSREYQEAYLGDGDDEDYPIGSEVDEYTHQAKEKMDASLAKFGLILKEKYRIEEHNIDDDIQIFYPLLHIIDMQKFLDLLEKIQTKEDTLGSSILTVLSGLKDQLMERDKIEDFEIAIPKLRKELIRIGFRDDYMSKKYNNLFLATERGYLDEMIFLQEMGFVIGHRHDNAICREMADLPKFLQDMIDIIFEAKQDGWDVDKKIERATTRKYLDEAIRQVKKFKKSEQVFAKARTDLLAGLMFILEELSTSSLHPEEFAKDIKEANKKILDM